MSHRVEVQLDRRLPVQIAATGRVGGIISRGHLKYIHVEFSVDLHAFPLTRCDEAMQHRRNYLRIRQYGNARLGRTARHSAVGCRHLESHSDDQDFWGAYDEGDDACLCCACCGGSRVQGNGADSALEDACKGTSIHSPSTELLPPAASACAALAAILRALAMRSTDLYRSRINESISSDYVP